MALLAASGIASAVPFLLVLACPLLMIFMMRGMQGGHGAESHHGQRARQKPAGEMSLDELKAERDVLNEEIGRRAELRQPVSR